MSYFLAPQAAEELEETFNWTIEPASMRACGSLRRFSMSSSALHGSSIEPLAWEAERAMGV